MFLCTIFIYILQLQLTFNKESDCGCGVDRSQTRNDKNSKLLSADLGNVNQCSNAKEHEFECVKDSFDITQQMILVPAGAYQVGTNDVAIESDGEGPKKIMNLNSFYIDKYEVSNRDFYQFTKETSYKTEAEVFGDSFVFESFLNNTFREQMTDYRAVQAPWWYKIVGANWRHPSGPDSEITDLMDHPVTHVSWRDARAYCTWRGARLPTEAEWEAACRGGHQDSAYPWGDKLFPERKHMANIWQGTFPKFNSAKDGYLGTNPVHLFPQNDFGLHNMAGNVWEWTENAWSESKPEEKVKKGGSYLCHRSYCYRYRCSARSHNTEDSSAGNLGFRCVKSA